MTYFYSYRDIYKLKRGDKLVGLETKGLVKQAENYWFVEPCETTIGIIIARTLKGNEIVGDYCRFAKISPKKKIG